ncbi:hypothetical protein [Streptomyces mirabilis]|uniref:hypothetical protein n=1 Tax=Streptomyces mirabilis TaxID=68239 RepID=UPI00225A2D1B|nr:hypothetical protein [Streptomyces mirabilis]MCX4608698.1 hypothetical protein [Streptomyces mirabilis]
MSPEARQEALERHGLTEGPDGLDVTLGGLQRALKRALALRDEGDEEAARMLALSPEDLLRWEYCRCIQIEAFPAEVHRSGI